MIGEFSRAGRTGHPKRDITNTQVLLFRNLGGRAGLADSSLIEMTRRRFGFPPSRSTTPCTHRCRLPELHVTGSPARNLNPRYLTKLDRNQAGSKRTVARCQPRDRLMAAWVSGERRPRNRSPKAGEEKAEWRGTSSLGRAPLRLELRFIRGAGQEWPIYHF